MNTGKRFRRGLVVGKFCPLHRGHMLVIDTALDCCDEVLVISYTLPGFPNCERSAREAWLAALYPGVDRLVIDEASLALQCAARGIAPLAFPADDAPDAVQRAFTAWLCASVRGVAVDAVFTSEDYGDGFAAAMSAHFKAPVAHVCVDRARALVPVSGTAIRADPHAHRAFLAPGVYAHFVERVCLLGGESSGKTTLAAALADRLGTAMVPEVGRARWEEQGGCLGYPDMRAIAEDQVALEDRLAGQARRWLICDGSALTSACYSEHDYGRIRSLRRWQAGPMPTPSSARRISRLSRMARGAMPRSGKASTAGTSRAWPPRELPIRCCAARSMRVSNRPARCWRVASTVPYGSSTYFKIANDRQ